MTYLNLEHIKLTYLPTALGKLSSLNYLLLLDNPLTSLDAIIFVSMSSKLRTLSITTLKFNSFPYELHVLKALKSLKIHNITFPDWNSTMFQIFETSLTDLDMSYANFTSIPSAVCDLHYLKTLTVSHSPTLGTSNVPLFDKCSGKLTFTTKLVLQYDELTTLSLPSFSILFPALKTLHLDYNSLNFIKRSAFTGLLHLTALHISNNQLTRIPFTVNMARNLNTLNLKANQIRIVEDCDLSYPRNLTMLILWNNPLFAISQNALRNIPSLYEINLYNTLLNEVPPALLRLRHLGTVYESGLPIDCSCQSMSYLKTWNVQSVHLYATCSSGESVKRFLTSNLTKCH